jgi:hypothetical protein
MCASLPVPCLRFAALSFSVSDDRSLSCTVPGTAVSLVSRFVRLVLYQVNVEVMYIPSKTPRPMVSASTVSVLSMYLLSSSSWESRV